MDIVNMVEYLNPILKVMKKSNKALVYNGNLIAMNDESSIMYTTDIIQNDIVIANHLDYRKIFIDNTIDYRIYHELLDKYNYIINMERSISGKCIVDNLESDEVFSELLKLKARDPAHKYILDNIYVPVFYGYLPINKGDTLSILGGYIEDGTVLIKYIVYKKKLKKNISIYLRLLPLPLI